MKAEFSSTDLILETGTESENKLSKLKKPLVHSADKPLNRPSPSKNLAAKKPQPGQNLAAQSPQNLAPLAIPPRYLIYGTGRVGRFLARYATNLGLNYTLCGRSTENLEAACEQATHILLAVPDASIQAAGDHLARYAPQARLVHFSGSQTFAGISSAHPLCAIADRPMPPLEMRSIYFVIEPSSGSLPAILPDFPNPWGVLPEDLRPLYHALCVLAGPGTTALWTEVSRQFQKLEIPPLAIHSYINSVFQNFAGTQNTNPLTGPWVRGDLKTIELNRQALGFQPLFAAYVALQGLAAEKSQEKSQEIDKVLHEIRS